MTTVNIHGILAQEYGNTFELALGNPRNTLRAIDCNRKGFLGRFIELHKQGLCYDLIINKTRVTEESQVKGFVNPETIDLVPAITGSGPAAIVSAIFKAVLFAAISYALAPKPEEAEALELTASAGKESLIFSNVANLASQGAPLPVGYGRLKVGSQVIQATVKSYPQSQKTRDALRGRGTGSSKASDTWWITNKRTDQ
jgi:predicted phage tail protein|tara:strand:+ start:3631 stop:4227 length:597 start_codon:yes stop_codon:yes gene_type:complete